MIKMNKEQLVDQLLQDLLHEEKKYHHITIPTNYIQKRRLLRGVMNLRLPKPISEEVLKKEDTLLQLELQEKHITDVNEIKPKEGKIAIWRGDITTLKIGAIVNAGNASLLGCFIPNHTCIDNAIHTYAGMRLRLACQNLMKGKEVATGTAKITPAFQLPSDYVIHTVGPIVSHHLTEKEITELKNCYISCLDIARKNHIRTIAFPCISTGVFHFPKEKASEIAVSTVRDYVIQYPDCFDKIVFNVFTKEDEQNYDRLF